LLSSASHDLRTPLAAITGAVSSLPEDEAALDLVRRRELAQVTLERPNAWGIPDPIPQPLSGATALLAA
jgi:K+-sensing histidine kinase KdpD